MNTAVGLKNGQPDRKRNITVHRRERREREFFNILCDLRDLCGEMLLTSFIRPIIYAPSGSGSTTFNGKIFWPPRHQKHKLNMLCVIVPLWLFFYLRISVVSRYFI